MSIELPTCDACGAEHGEEALFCSQCGVKLPLQTNASFFRGAADLDGYNEIPLAALHELDEPTVADVPADVAPAAVDEQAPERTSWRDRLHLPHRTVKDSEITSAEGEPAGELLVDDAEAAEHDDSSDWPTRRRRVFLLGGAAAAVLCIAGVSAAALAWSGQPSPTPTPTPTHTASSGPRFVTLPGWATSPVWDAAKVIGPVAFSADGARIARASGTNVTIAAASTGKVLAESTLDGDPFDGVRAVVVDGTSSFMVQTDAGVRLWVGADLTEVDVPLDAADRLVVRSDVPIVVRSGGAFEILTGAGAIPLTTPRPGLAPLAMTTEGSVTWASARGAVVIAAVNGAIVHDVALAPPAPGATAAKWLRASDTVVVVRWAMPDGSTVVGTSLVSDGSLVGQLPAAGDLNEIPTDRAGTSALVGTAVLSLATGEVQPLPEGFVPGYFVGDRVYGATATGAPALAAAGEVVPLDAPTVVPVGLADDQTLITLTRDTLQAFAVSDSRASTDAPGRNGKEHH